MLPLVRAPGTPQPQCLPPATVTATVPAPAPGQVSSHAPPYPFVIGWTRASSGAKSGICRVLGVSPSTLPLAESSRQTGGVRDSGEGGSKLPCTFRLCFPEGSLGRVGFSGSQEKRRWVGSPRFCGHPLQSFFQKCFALGFVERALVEWFSPD